MAPIITKTGEVLVAVLKLAVILFFGFIFLVILSTVWGMPLHNFDLWRLERNFNITAPQYHPPESVLLEKKEYLGGPQEHGSLVCDLYVGELRSAPFSKEDIRAAYSGEKSFEVLFPAEDGWTMDSPLGNWWDEWHESPIITASSTVYFVFFARRNIPFLGDMRCDD